MMKGGTESTEDRRGNGSGSTPNATLVHFPIVQLRDRAAIKSHELQGCLGGPNLWWRSGKCGVSGPSFRTNGA
eukprot:16439079-Heterocapsa_arctica.AAC.1